MQESKETNMAGTPARGRRRIPPPTVLKVVLVLTAAYVASDAVTGLWMHNLAYFLSVTMMFLCGWAVGRSDVPRDDREQPSGTRRTS